MSVEIEQRWKVGDRVRSLPEHAWLRPGPWGEKLSKDRGGVVVEVPLETRSAGEGTLLIEWDALVGEKRNAADWTIWVHSSLIAREALDA